MMPSPLRVRKNPGALLVLALCVCAITTNTLASADPQSLIERGWVRYSDFGAKGDGKTDDVRPLAAAHAFANEHGLPVMADDGATYYIGGGEVTVEIRTDTDFGEAAFIIDDTDVQNRNAPVFSVASALESVPLEGFSTLRKNQRRIDVPVPGPGLITVTDSTVRRFIRFGLNPNKGVPQTDIFLVNKEGVVNPQTPIVWHFDEVTEARFLPMDETTLTITGGKFTTLANREESNYTYYHRGLSITRSNVIVDGVEHRVTGEGDTGAPYNGFINISNCAHVTIKNAVLTGRKVYETIGRASLPVPMGSYDITVNRALNVTFEDCTQTNDIHDPTYWGIMGSNFCKNLVYDRCTLSRFDAHMGVANATIRNSTLGHQGINTIGSGTFVLENSTVTSRSLINLREDYGSTWEGEFIIRDCVFVPTTLKNGRATVISGANNGQHDFGYSCTMPERITIENLRIEDPDAPENYQGPTIFADFNPEMRDDRYFEKYPYIVTKEVVLMNVEATSTRRLRISNNDYMFRRTVIR